MAFINATTLDENTLFLRAFVFASENGPPRDHDRRLCVTSLLVSQLTIDT